MPSSPVAAIPIKSMVAGPAPKREDDIQERLEKVLQVVEMIFTSLCNISGRQILCIKSRDRRRMRGHEYYGKLPKNAKFYWLVRDERTYPPNVPTDCEDMPIDCTQEEKALLNKGASVLNMCQMSSASFLEITKALVAGLDEEICVSWMYCTPNPRFVLFPEESKGEYDRAYAHDVLHIHTGAGDFVVDLSGAQFGFKKWFYTRKEYIENNVRREQGLDLGVRNERTFSGFRLGKGGRADGKSANTETVYFVQHFTLEVLDYVQSKYRSDPTGSADQKLKGNFVLGVRSAEKSYQILQELSDDQRKEAYHKVNDLLQRPERLAGRPID